MMMNSGLWQGTRVVHATEDYMFIQAQDSEVHNRTRTRSCQVKSNWRSAIYCDNVQIILANLVVTHDHVIQELPEQACYLPLNNRENLQILALPV